MRERVREALQAGAIGVSTGLYYEPANAASTEEVIGICKPLAEFAFHHAHFHHFARNGRRDNDALLKLAGLQPQQLQPAPGLIAHTPRLIDGSPRQRRYGLRGQDFFLRHRLMFKQIRDPGHVGAGLIQPDFRLPECRFGLHERRFGLGHRRTFDRHQRLTTNHRISQFRRHPHDSTGDRYHRVANAVRIGLNTGGGGHLIDGHLDRPHRLYGHLLQFRGRWIHYDLSGHCLPGGGDRGGRSGGSGLILRRNGFGI